MPGARGLGYPRAAFESAARLEARVYLLAHSFQCLLRQRSDVASCVSPGHDADDCRYRHGETANHD